MWVKTIKYRQYPDETVTVRCVNRAAIQALNKQYRGHDEPTNVLTFSYDGQHDIALCVEVAATEATARQLSIRDHVAHLLVHAFLHATGLDHERSVRQSDQARQAEEHILRRAGFEATNL
jgi:probable rRNA maturation factor